MTQQTAEMTTDIIVAGAGSAGLSAAIAFAQAGFSVVCIGKIPAHAPGRTVASALPTQLG